MFQHRARASRRLERGTVSQTCQRSLRPMRNTSPQICRLRSRRISLVSMCSASKPSLACNSDSSGSARVSLILVRLFVHRPVRKQPFEPNVTLLVPAYNEAAHIAGKIRNSLALDYPASKLEVLIACDGSRDATPQIAQSVADGVHVKEEIELRWIRPYGLGPHPPGTTRPFVKLKAVARFGYLAGISGGLATPALRRHAGYRVLLGLAAIHFVYFTFYEGMKFNYYLIHLPPLYLSLLAIFLHFLWIHRPSLRLVTGRQPRRWLPWV